MSVTEWADKFRMLPAESAAAHGKWRTAKVPFMQEIMDAYNDDDVRRIVMKFSAQMSKTEGLLNMVGYAMDRNPGPMMLVQPTEGMAKAFVKDRLDPTIRDTSVLSDKVRTATRDELEGTGRKETLLHKTFPGGHLTMIGGNSPAQMASRPIRDVFVDEIDRIERSVGKKGAIEGDPLMLIEKRQTTFWNKKSVISSTPTVEGVSRIDELWELGTMERYHVPCPHCGATQILIFQNLKWEDGAPELAYYECMHCQERITDRYKQAMLAAGTWLAEHPERKDQRSFHINELYSPWRSFGDIASAFLEAKKNVDTLRVFINTVLGECWKTNNSQQLDHEGLMAREEEYKAEVPMYAAVITAAVDVQQDRLELMFMGHGAQGEKWVLATDNAEGNRTSPIVIWGSPQHESTWRMLDRHLFRQFKHETGRLLRCSLALVDAGDGNTSDFVYKYTKGRNEYRVFASKGSSTPGAPLTKRPTDGNQYRAKLFSLGVDAAKDMLMDSFSKVTEPGPGYIHMPLGIEEETYRQMTAEKVTIQMKAGVKYRKWVKTRERNEALDLLVMNLCAFTILNVGDIGQLIEEMRAGRVPARKGEED